MKNFKSAVLLLSLIALLQPTAYASSYVNKVLSMCKDVAGEQFSSSGENMRIKFKRLSGSQVSPRVFLQVLPKGGDSFRAVCDVDGKKWEVVSLNRIDG